MVSVIELSVASQPRCQPANVRQCKSVSCCTNLILDLENANPGKGLTDGGQDEFPDGLEPGRVFVVNTVEANVPQPIKNVRITICCSLTCFGLVYL